MDKNRLNEIIKSLENKQVNQPCPRCSSNNFSIVGESEISVTQRMPPAGGLMGLAGSTPKIITMPIIIVTCNNCGYVSQHAQAALGLTYHQEFGLGLRGLSRNNAE